MKGRHMNPDLILFGAAILVLIVVAFMIANKDNSDYQKILDSNNDLKARLHKAEKDIKELKDLNIVEYQNAQGQELLDQKKRIAEVEAKAQKVVDFTPQINVMFPKGLRVLVKKAETTTTTKAPPPNPKFDVYGPGHTSPLIKHQETKK